MQPLCLKFASGLLCAHAAGADQMQRLYQAGCGSESGFYLGRIKLVEGYRKRTIGMPLVILSR